MSFFYFHRHHLNKSETLPTPTTITNNSLDNTHLHIHNMVYPTKNITSHPTPDTTHHHPFSTSTTLDLHTLTQMEPRQDIHPPMPTTCPRRGLTRPTNTAHVRMWDTEGAATLATAVQCHRRRVGAADITMDNSTPHHHPSARIVRR